MRPASQYFLARLSWRRGSTLSLVLCLYLALGSVLLGAVTMAATATRAGERDYRRSQALALAEAGVAEAQSGLPPHGSQPLGEGAYSWTITASGSDRLIVARGEVLSPGSGPVTRTIRVRAVGTGAGWKVKAWEEGP